MAPCSEGRAQERRTLGLADPSLGPGATGGNCRRNARLARGVGAPGQIRTGTTLRPRTPEARASPDFATGAESGAPARTRTGRTVGRSTASRTATFTEFRHECKGWECGAIGLRRRPLRGLSPDVVRSRGVEPPSLTAFVPQTNVYTIPPRALERHSMTEILLRVKDKRLSARCPLKRGLLRLPKLSV